MKIRLFIFLLFLFSSLSTYSANVNEKIIKLEKELGIVQKKYGTQSSQFANLLLKKADIYSSIDKVDSALVICDQACDIIYVKFGGKSPEYGKALVKKANAFLTKGDVSKGDETIARAINILRENGSESSFYPDLEEYKAVRLFRNRKYIEAGNIYLKLAEYYRGLNKPSYSYDLLVLNCEIFSKKRTKVPEELKNRLINECLRYFDDKSLEYGHLLFFLGHCYIYTLDYENARKTFSEALNVISINVEPNTLKYLKCAARLINSQILTHRTHEADILIEQLLSHDNSGSYNESWWEEGRILISLYKGIMLLNKRLYDDALKAFNYVMYNVPGNSSLRDDVNLQFIKLYLNCGNPRRALDFCAELELKHVSNGANTVEDQYFYMAELYKLEALSQTDTKEALEFGSDLLKRVKSRTNDNNRERMNRIALGALLLVSKCALMHGLSNSDYEYVRLSLELLALFKKSCSDLGIYCDHRALAVIPALCNIYLNDSGSAFENLKEFFSFLKERSINTIKFIPSSKRNDYWSTNQPLFNWLVPMLGTRVNNTLFDKFWFETSLFNKGFLLDADISLRSQMKAEEIKEIRKFQNASNALNSAIAQLTDKETVDSLIELCERAELNLLHTLSSEQIAFRREKICFEEIQSYLNNQECAIEFVSFSKPSKDNILFQGENSLETFYALVVKSTGEILKVALPELSDIKFSTDNLNTLQQAVWKPLESALKGVGTVFFSPTGILHSLPIEHCFPNSKVNLVRLSNLKNIKDKYESPTYTSAVVFGGLDYDNMTENNSLQPNAVNYSRLDNLVIDSNLRAGVLYLPSTKIEAESVSNRLRAIGVACEVFEGSFGTESVFKSISGRKTDIIHIATHGFFYDSSVERRAPRYLYKLFKSAEGLTTLEMAMIRSGLIMSGANNKLRGVSIKDSGSQNNDDGVLTAREIAMLDLSNVDLVVLSACQTAQGLVHADGVYGLQRSFKLAGVKSILMSLWQVDDDATCILMDYFYRGLAAGLTKSDALRAARNRLKTHPRFNNPKYWAPFILID